MKKIIPVLFMCVFSIGFSQNKKTTNTYQYEWKGNALLMLSGAVDLSYEKYIDDDSSYGLTVFLAYDKTINRKFGFTPYYRVYFGQK